MLEIGQLNLWSVSVSPPPFASISYQNTIHALDPLLIILVNHRAK